MDPSRKLGGVPEAREPGPVTRSVRQARTAIERKLAAIASEIGGLDAVPPGARRALMERVGNELEASLRPHLAWEEKTIHPIADKYACEGPTAFCSSMRYEHEVIYRWLAELRELAEGDAAAFVRRADNLLGVVLAHFEVEEHVLLPILDRMMSSAAFQPQVGDPRGP